MAQAVPDPHQASILYFEVVQVYIRWKDSSLPAPKIQLAWFQRVTVSAGQQLEVRFEIEAKIMALWIDDGWFVKPGESGEICTSVLFIKAFTVVILRRESSKRSVLWSTSSRVTLATETSAVQAGQRRFSFSCRRSCEDGKQYWEMLLTSPSRLD